MAGHFGGVWYRQRQPYRVRALRKPEEASEMVMPAAALNKPILDRRPPLRAKGKPIIDRTCAEVVMQAEKRRRANRPGDKTAP